MVYTSPQQYINSFSRRLDSQLTATMAEQQQQQRLESQRLCANNCGFFGSPATLNLCSKCFRQSSTVNISVNLTEVPAEFPTPLTVPFKAAEESLTEALTKTAAANRCSACNKRVGLTGFVCRCGDTFCGTHRYAEKHTCVYDFKTEGKEAIARANPVVRAEKLKKI